MVSVRYPCFGPNLIPIRLDKDLKYPIQLENMRYFGMLMKKK